MSVDTLTIVLLLGSVFSNLTIMWFLLDWRDSRKIKDEIPSDGQPEQEEITDRGNVTLYEWQPPKSQEELLAEKVLKEMKNG